MKDNHFLQVALQAAKDGLSVFSAILLALPNFLASAVGAKANLCKNFDLEHENELCNDASELRFRSAKYEAAPNNEIQKKLLEHFLIRKLLNDFETRKDVTED